MFSPGKKMASFTTLPSNTQSTTAINSIDAKTNNNSLVVVQTPLYQAEFGKLIGQTGTEYWRSSSDTRVYHRKWNYEWCW